MRAQTYESLIAWQRPAKDLEFINSLPTKHRNQIYELLKLSRSQLRQDLLVLSQTNFKENGYFVEFGATDGISLSNTYLLESNFSWRGILAEPAEVWRGSLIANRKASISSKCVWSESGKSLKFKETENPELSGVIDLEARDQLMNLRDTGVEYDVITISLQDLLQENNAPSYIDYLSIDTEGSELEILKAFDFDRYKFGIITCEHNFTENQEKIRMLLESHGYKQVYQHLSEFDGWFIASDLEKL
jgi:FkbM family methyltransferase